MSGERQRPTLDDVARRAGTSAATVSRVLNRHGAGDEDTRRRILTAAAELGYERRCSVGLANGGTLALAIPDIRNPYYAEMVRSIQDEAESSGLAVLLFITTEESRRQQRVIRMLSQQRLDGIIFCGTRLPVQDLIALHRNGRRAVVVINREVHHPGIPCIRVDYQEALYRVGQYLLRLGHRHIGHLSGPAGWESAQARCRGLELVLREAGLSLRPEWCPATLPNVEGGFQTMSHLLSLPSADRPTAVVAFNDIVALGALNAVRSHGLRVPDDLSLVGFDDIPMAAHANPPLTTVAQPKQRLGRLAVEMLQQMRQGALGGAGGHTLLEAPLVVRESTGPPKTAGP